MGKYYIAVTAMCESLSFFSIRKDRRVLNLLPEAMMLDVREVGNYNGLEFLQHQESWKTALIPKVYFVKG
jgi:hypothetical protein